MYSLIGFPKKKKTRNVTLDHQSVKKHTQRETTTDTHRGSHTHTHTHTPTHVHALRSQTGGTDGHGDRRSLVVSPPPDDSQAQITFDAACRRKQKRRDCGTLDQGGERGGSTNAKMSTTLPQPLGEREREKNNNRELALARCSCPWARTVLSLRSQAEKEAASSPTCSRAVRFMHGASIAWSAHVGGLVRYLSPPPSWLLLFVYSTSKTLKLLVASPEVAAVWALVIRPFSVIAKLRLLRRFF